MTALVFPLPTSAHQDTIDFLRRLLSMPRGGCNAEMLLEAASMIETLSKRASDRQADDHARNLELREVAELQATI